MMWSVARVKRIPADGIDYADTNTLVVSDGQLAKWKEAAKAWLAGEQERKDHERWAVHSAAAKAAAKALAENEEQAARNDPYGQLRMGERYWYGEGVKKDPVLARAYLKQAADQGSPSASEFLRRISAASPTE